MDLFISTLETDSKELEYIQRSLRSAKTISLEGGNVTAIYRDQVFRMCHDHRRRLHTEPVIGKLYDSSPVQNVQEAVALRYLNTRFRTKIYNETSHGGSWTKYRKYADLAVRTFIKLVLAKSPLLPDVWSTLNSYDKIIKFVKAFDPTLKVNKHQISMLKGRNVMIRQIPRLEYALNFLRYVSDVFPSNDWEKYFVPAEPPMPLPAVISLPSPLASVAAESSSLVPLGFFDGLFFDIAMIPLRFHLTV